MWTRATARKRLARTTLRQYVEPPRGGGGGVCLGLLIAFGLRRATRAYRVTLGDDAIRIESPRWRREIAWNEVERIVVSTDPNHAGITVRVTHGRAVRLDVGRAARVRFEFGFVEEPPDEVIRLLERNGFARRESGRRDSYRFVEAAR